MDIKETLNINEHQHKIYMPNEIFADFKVLHDKGSSHVAFAYTYYYLISWLYRYAKYGEMDIDVKLIKSLLGYSANSKEIDYIIKKNGILDQIGYSESSTDYPIAWEFNDGDIQFTMLSEMETDIQKMIKKNKGRNSKIKIPVKGLVREEDIEGTFYDISNTHMIDFELFVKCMGDKKLGCSGFYLMGFLNWKCKMHGGKYNSSVERIAADVGFSVTHTEKYLGRLIWEGLIGYEKSPAIHKDGKLIQLPNTYNIN